MLTIKWTQTAGAISIIETKILTVIFPETDSWVEYKKANPNFTTDEVRGLVMYDDGTIAVMKGDNHLYVVNGNGKTVQTV